MLQYCSRIQLRVQSWADYRSWPDRQLRSSVSVTTDVPDVICAAGTVVDDAANAAADQTFTGTTVDAPPVASAASSEST